VSEKEHVVGICQKLEAGFQAAPCSGWAYWLLFQALGMLGELVKK